MRANTAMLPPTHPRILRTTNDLISDSLVVSDFDKKDWLR